MSVSLYGRVGVSDSASRPLARDPWLWVVLACATVVRFFGLFRHPTIVDEAFTYYIASHSVPQIIQLLRIGDFHPPLSYLLGHALLRLTSRAYELRVVTALFGVMGVAASYALARRIVGAWAPFAALLVALDPLLVFYDGMFRMYAMLWSLAALSWASLLWALDAPRSAWRWIAYGLVITALLYTQYLALFTLLAQIGFIALLRPRTLGFWLATVFSFAAFAPWLPVLALQYPLGGTAFNTQLAGHAWELLQAPAVLLIDGVPPSLEYALPMLVALNLIVLGGFIVACLQRNWAALALFAPIVLQAVYAFASGKLIFGERYLLQAVVPLSMFCALLCAWLAARFKPAAIAVACGLILLAVAGTVDKHLLAPYQPFDWTEYGHFLDARIAPGDAVVFDGGLSYYALIGTKATQSRHIYLISNPSDARRFAAHAARLPKVWYIGYQSQLPDPDRLVFQALERTHPQHVSWRSTPSAYGDVVLTAFFGADAAARVP
jgi:hypothetical protein